MLAKVANKDTQSVVSALKARGSADRMRTPMAF
jgi:hypothetical protein